MFKFRQQLLKKIKILDETIWEGKAKDPRINRWLENFEDKAEAEKNERLHALYLLSQFMYFGDKEIRELLKALYRDLVKYPIIEQIRRNNGDILDFNFIKKKFEEELCATRFLGIGNPSESGTYLLYYFRQENSLSKDLFIHTHQIFRRYGEPRNISIRDININRYIFIDDLCSSGTQAIDYSNDILDDIKKLKPEVEVMYYTLFGLEDGIKNIRRKGRFDAVEAVFALDNSFRCFHSDSRYFIGENRLIDCKFAKDMCIKYGSKIYCSRYPLGYNNDQLLLGFHHNIPDNTLPIIWAKKTGKESWEPIFKRYEKEY